MQCTSFWEMPNSFWGIPLIYKLHINKVYLLLRGSIYKFVYINTAYLHLRDAKLLLRDSICKLYINTVYLLLMDVKPPAEGFRLQVIHKYSVLPSEGCQTPSEGFRLQVKNKHLLRDANLHLRDSILAFLRFWSLILLVSKYSFCLTNRRV